MPEQGTLVSPGLGYTPPVTVALPTDPAAFLWFFFWAGIAITVVFALALYYHWVRFAGMYPLSLIMLPIYTVGVLVFIGAMLSGLALT